MKIESGQQKLSFLYIKAKKKFEECIGNEENKFLKKEVSLPLDHIKIIEKDIKIVFSHMVFDQYLIEVSLILFDGDKEIGMYMYIENENEEAIDDTLVFY